jgi:hypothetical protein
MQKKLCFFSRKFKLHLNYYKQEVKDIIYPLKIKTDKFVRNYIELIIWLFNVFKLSIYNFSYKSFEGVHRIIRYFVLSVIITIYLSSHRVILTVSTNWYWYWTLLVSVTSSTLMFLIKTIMSALKASTYFRPKKKSVFPIAWSSKLGSVGQDFLFFLFIFFLNLQVCSFL